MLSLILPAYNEEENIREVARITSQILDQLDTDYEIIFIDDGSVDKTFAKIAKLAEENHRVRAVKFSRNYGKEASVMAGLKAAKGDCVAVMDCDLQHPPEHLIQMYELWKQGYKIIEGVKTNRGKESWIYSKFSKLFYKMSNKFIDVDLSGASDYKLLDRELVDILVELPEKDTFFRGLSVYFGFPKAEVKFEVAERASGDTKWTLFGLFRYAVNSLTSFTAFPLYLITMLGSFLLLIFLIVGVQTLCNYMVGGAVEGFTTVILLLLLIGSTTLISMGIIGHYIAKIYEEVKGRPRYIVEKTLGYKEFKLDQESKNRNV